MKRTRLALAILFAICTAPAFAAESSVDAQNVDKQKLAADAKQPASDEKQAGETKAKNGGKAGGKHGPSLGERLAPVRTVTARVLSTAVSAPLGIPIAAVRYAMGEDLEQTKALPYISESTNKPVVWAGRAIVAPTSAWIGLISAPIYSVAHSWKASGDKPFSKECFGFGPFDDGLCPY